MSKWNFIIGFLIAVIAFSMVVTIATATHEPLTIYEDGSGRLPDGRGFCIDGELCELP